MARIKEKAVKFLISCKDENWIFSKDVHINFCVLSALAGYNKEIINGKAIANILTGLVSIESKEGGPYYSYFVDNDDKNIDLAANVSIAYFLSLEGVDLCNLNDLIEAAIEKRDLKSRFYQNDHPIIYFISQFYKGGKKEKLIKIILGRMNKEIDRNDPFNAVLAIIALSSLGYEMGKLEGKLRYLINLPEWEVYGRYPFYFSKKVKVSTKELNSAFYCEALRALGKKKSSRRPKKAMSPRSVIEIDEEAEMFGKISKLASERFSALSNEIKTIAVHEIQKTIKGNVDKQMSLIPYYFKKALGRKAKKISDDKISHLGFMNIFFWTAFVIYDDFWDEEGTPRILPSANLFARTFIEFFDGLYPHDSEFNSFFQRLMDALDSGNTWILVHCRAKANGKKIEIPKVIPDYGDYEAVYQPSSAHILGPVAMLYELGYKMNSPEMKNLISFFKNYLIAMQINDDIHDWEEDLKKGHLSTVVVILLKDFGRLEGEIDIEEDLEELKKTFWFKTLPKACNVAIEHIQRSLQALKKITILEDPSPLEKLVLSIQNVSKIALKEQEYTIDFLKTYKSTMQA